MNFLAHIYLSGDNELLKLGNIMGDFMRGNDLDSYEDEIRKGVKLHRSIDSFTDSHLIVLESKKRLRSKYHHYAPVIIDIFYDHFLALDWEKHHHQPLAEYVSHFYQIMGKHTAILPERLNQMMVYMKRDNWLLNYQFFEGINKVFHGMSRRTKFESKMEHAVEDLKLDYEQYHEEFNLFFPDLVKHSEEFIQTYD